MNEKSALVRDLEKVVEPTHVVWKPEDLLVYEYDGSIDRNNPGAVVVPATAEQVAEIIKIARKHEVPVVPRGAGTGLSGGAIAMDGAIVLVLTRLNKVLEIDKENRVAIVEPGVVNLELGQAVAPYGLQYVPDPSSQSACTIGGNVGENAGGPHCLAYGVTTNHVLGMEVVLADGTVTWLGGDSREVPGYDLRGVFIGSEGTLGVVTKVAVRLVPIPEAIRTMVAAFSSVEAASETVADIVASGVIPGAVEMIDRLCIEAVEPAFHPGYPEDAQAILLVEVDGLIETVAEQAALVEELCRKHGTTDWRTAEDEVERETLWASRKKALGALGRLAPNYYLIDGVIPPTRLPETMSKINALSDELDIPIANVLHAGDGNLHPCILFDSRDPVQVEKALIAGGRILEMCVEVGGALSGEHGIGLEKQGYLPLVFTDEDLEAMARLKPAFGAAGMFNPGKIFPTDEQRTGLPHGAIMQRLTADMVI
ncbi:MAG TPA: FAD-binding protein [Dehalococcoidia bacterium]|nr:FAD-binding protein [Dehalococcoidia bacterium]